MLVKAQLFTGTANVLKKHDKGCATEYTVKPIESMNCCSNSEIFMLKLCCKFVFKSTSLHF